ncbi:PIR protein [Plasmodium vivax]|uniref:VIR protein n=1 Tax=Plasmodium vivax TaxID=5855 RepID=A0A565A6Z5_PLAVI|nr:PIR protein [Plasmodium vivax]
MCSTRSRDEEIYEFFDNIEEYIKKAKTAESPSVFTKAEKGCNAFMNSSGSYFKDEDTAKGICVQYIKLYDSLSDLTSTSRIETNYKKCRKFLNYWVNFKFRENMKNEDYSVCNVYDFIESQFTANTDFNVHIGLIDNINKDDLYKMNILYRLYKIYTDLDDIVDNATNHVKKKLSSLSSACCTDYLVANYMCNGGNGDNINPSQFCMQLQKFKKKYEGLYVRVNRNGVEYSNNFIQLTQCNNNTVSTALIGTTVGLVPLLVGLYKFTPLRQLMNFKKGKLTQEYRNNEDEMRNIMLMDQGSEHISSQQGTYNIKYHSV